MGKIYPLSIDECRQLHTCVPNRGSTLGEQMLENSMFQKTRPPRGWVTLTLAFIFILIFRVEQNLAYILGMSTQQLIGVDIFPFGSIIQGLAPFLHGNANHLISTLIWFIPFGYLLECRQGWKYYIQFVIFAGILTTTFGPALFMVFGLTSGLAIGGSGITYALIAREATVRSITLVGWRNISRFEWGILSIVLFSFLIKLMSFITSSPSGTSSAAHITGFVIGFLAGLREETKFGSIYT